MTAHEQVVQQSPPRTRRLTFEQIDTTEDTGDPVIQADLPDTGSWLIVIPDPFPDPECLRVQQVDSKRRGDMKTMLDEIVTQLGQTTLRFMNPLDELKSGDAPRLKDRLYGFESDRETFEKPSGEEITVETYVGEWVVSDD